MTCRSRMMMKPWCLTTAALLCAIFTISAPGCSDDVTPTPDAQTDQTILDGGVDGPSVDGPMADLPVADGAADGPAADGPIADSPVGDGPVADGPLTDGPLTDGGPIPDSGPTPDSGPLPDSGPTPDSAPALDSGSPPGCGNGVREGIEQCDDGNTQNLDGCDASCRFELSMRATYLKLQAATSSFCTKNAFGGAFNATALGLVQPGLDAAIADGSVNLLMHALGLDDLSGTSDPSLKLGMLTADPPTCTSGYNGTSDLDWPHVAGNLGYDANRVPKNQLSASITSHVLTAGPGRAMLPFVVCAVYCTPANIIMANTKIQITLGATSKPTIKTGTACPGHLPSEHLDPTLTAVEKAGLPTAAGAGSMCGDMTADSLRLIPAPPALTGMCSEGYLSTANMLDVIVGGCTAYGFQAIKPTQPDGEDPDVPVAGAGPPYTLVLSASKTVTGCKDKNGTTVSSAGLCYKDAAYSSFFRLAAGRVILK